MENFDVIVSGNISFYVEISGFAFYTQCNMENLDDFYVENYDIYRLCDLYTFFKKLAKKVKNNELVNETSFTCNGYTIFTIYPKNLNSMEEGFEILTRTTQDGCDGYEDNKTNYLTIPGLYVYQFLKKTYQRIEELLNKKLEKMGETYHFQIVDEIRNFSE